MFLLLSLSVVDRVGVKSIAEFKNSCMIWSWKSKKSFSSKVVRCCVKRNWPVLKT